MLLRAASACGCRVGLPCNLLALAPPVLTVQRRLHHHHHQHHHHQRHHQQQQQRGKGRSGAGGRTVVARAVACGAALAVLVPSACDDDKDGWNNSELSLHNAAEVIKLAMRLLQARTDARVRRDGATGDVCVTMPLVPSKLTPRDLGERLQALGMVEAKGHKGGNDVVLLRWKSAKHNTNLDTTLRLEPGEQTGTVKVTLTAHRHPLTVRDLWCVVGLLRACFHPSSAPSSGTAGPLDAKALAHVLGKDFAAAGERVEAAMRRAVLGNVLGEERVGVRGVPDDDDFDAMLGPFADFAREMEDTLRKAVPQGIRAGDQEDRSHPPSTPLMALEQLGAHVYSPSEEGILDWGNLAASNFVRDVVEDSVLLPLKNPALYDEVAKGTRQRFESNLPRAVLFSGPPGTGKTTVARIIASQTETPLVYLPVEAIVSKWYGEGEQKLAAVLEHCRKLEKGAIVFVDEIDALAQDRSTEMHEASRRLLSVLLRNVDGIEHGGRVILLGATNRPNDLDKALLSRFDVHVRFDLPSSHARELIVRYYAKHLGKGDVRQLAREAEGLAGRNIRDVCAWAERRWAGKRARGEVKDPLPPLSEYVQAVKTKRQLLKDGWE